MSHCFVTGGPMWATPAVHPGDIELIAEKARELAQLIRESTGSIEVGVTLAAYRMPPERWHLLTQAEVVMPRKERPTHIAKYLDGGARRFAAWCSEDDTCPSLVAAQAGWDAAEATAAGLVLERLPSGDFAWLKPS